MFLQALELLAATVASLVAIASATDAERGSTIALAVTVLVLCLGVGLIGWGLLVGRKHLLGAVLTIEVLEIAVSILAFQGVVAGAGSWWIGLVLLLPAVAGVALCFVKPVTDAFGRRPSDEPPAVSVRKGGDPRGKSGPTPKRR